MRHPARVLSDGAWSTLNAGGLPADLPRTSTSTTTTPSLWNEGSMGAPISFGPQSTEPATQSSWNERGPAEWLSQPVESGTSTHTARSTGCPAAHRSAIPVNTVGTGATTTLYGGIPKLMMSCHRQDRALVPGTCGTKRRNNVGKRDNDK